VNIFIPGDVDKWDLHMLHWSAWEKGMKSLYYCRSKSVQRAGFAGGLKAANDAAAKDLAASDFAAAQAAGGESFDALIQQNIAAAAAARTDYDECLACQ
jgi:ribonucleoside-diphosphate reductase alpha chain